MPEYFVPSYIVAKLGSEQTCFTLETNVGLLMAWNEDMYHRAGLSRATVAAISLEMAYSLSSRIDMVWYPSNAAWSPPEAIWLIEFKRHELSEADRNKLVAIMPLLDRAIGGAVFSIVNSAAESDWIVEEADRAREAGDSWYQCNVEAIPEVMGKKRFSVCGRAFMNPAAHWA